jgi:hypothetical protein
VRCEPNRNEHNCEDRDDNQGRAAAGDPTGLPRFNVVFRVWQCDKENHGWREGPPLTVACKRFDPLVGLSPSRQTQLERKKNSGFGFFAAICFWGLAGYLAQTGS